MSARNSGAARLAAIIVLIGTCSLIAVAQTDAVRLFNGRDGSGPAQDIPAGTYQVDGKQLATDESGKANISVSVPKGFLIRFCEQKDGTGKCDEFGEGIHNLASADFNFIRVWKGDPTPAITVASSAAAASPAPPRIAPLVVFEQKNWLGRSQVFAPGMYRSFRGEFGKINDNQARSVVITKGYRARFCSEEGLSYRGSGDCEVHEEGRHNLRFANSISFIEVTDLSDTSPADDKMPVVLYEDTSQEGKMQGFDVGTFSVSQGHFKKLGNDQASSIAVKDGYRATVCSDEPTAAGGEGSTCEEFGAGKKNLKNRKQASWIKVTKAN